MASALIKINPATATASLLILYPPLFSVLIKLVGVPLPSYVLVLAMSFLLLAAGLNIPSVRRHGSGVGRIYLAYFVMCLVSLAYTPADFAAEQKLGYMGYVLLFPLACIMVSVGMQRGSAAHYYEKLEASLVRHVFFCAALFTVLFFLFRYEESAGRYILPGIANPIWVSRYFGLLLIGLVYAFFKAGSRQHRNLAAGFGIVVLGGLFLSGSKTPFFAVFIVISLMLYSRNVSVMRLMKIAAFGALVLLPLVYFGSGSYILETEFFSMVYRLEAVGHVFESQRFWLGNGIASYGPIIFNDDVEAYPHNLYLEAFFELGIVGLGLMLLLTAKLVRSYDARLIDFFALYFWVNANMSGDVPGNAMFFTVAFVAVMTGQAKRSAGQPKRILNVIEKLP